MNVSPQYWFIIATFLSLTASATVAWARHRSLSSTLYACSAWLTLLSGAGLILEPLVASETAVLPDGVTQVRYSSGLQIAMTWGLTLSAVLATLASIAYVWSSPDSSSALPGNHTTA